MGGQDDSILDIRPFTDEGGVAASVPTIPEVARAPEPPISTPIIKKSPSSMVVEVDVHPSPASAAEESVEDGAGLQDLPEPFIRSPPISTRRCLAEISGQLAPIPEEDPEAIFAAGLGSRPASLSSVNLDEEVGLDVKKAEDAVMAKVEVLETGDVTTSLLSITVPIGGATSTPMSNRFSSLPPTPFSSNLHPLREDSFSSYPLILNSNPSLQISPPTSPNHSGISRSWSLPFPSSYLMAPIASPPPCYLSQLSVCKNEGGASDSIQEESDGARCLPPPTPSVIRDRRGARFRDCDLQRPYTPFIRKYWDSDSEDSVAEEKTDVVVSASTVSTCATTSTTTSPQATAITTTASPTCVPPLSDSVGGRASNGPRGVVPQSSDPVLKGKGLFRRFKARRGASQGEPTPRHVARLDFSNESLHLAGNDAPVLSPGGDSVFTEPPSPNPFFRILRKTPGSRSRRNPRLKGSGKADRVTRSQSRLSQVGLRVKVPEGTPKMG